jgi:inosose dehydratase
VGLPALVKAADETSGRVVAQTYIFMQDLQKKNKKIAGSQDEIFSTVAKAGFNQVELMSEFFTKDAAAGTLAALKKYNLQVPIVYFGGPMHSKEGSHNTYQDAVSLAERVRSIGVKAINTNPNPKPMRAGKTMDEMRIEADCLNRIATTIAKANLQLFLHHHDVELQNGAAEFKYLLLKTDLSLVKSCIDMHWAYRGGDNPMNILKLAGNRVASVHLRNSTKGVWSETLGDGDVDYRAIAKYLKTAKLKPYLVVELAYDAPTPITRDLASNLRMAREYTEKVFA